ncbi:hypothetical protein ACFL11_00360 [Patescibacteria group bacterium]
MKKIISQYIKDGGYYLIVPVFVLALFGLLLTFSVFIGPSHASSLPTVDIKANGFNEPITINYNTSVNLSWTSANVTSCQASGNWSGARPTIGSESINNLTSSRSYTLTCTGQGGTISDSITVNVGIQSTLSVALEAIPETGYTPLNDVDLKAAVTGTAQGTINYKFDCQNDGVWDYIFNNISTNPKTVTDACDYSSPGTFSAKVYIERGTSNFAQDTVQITVSSYPGSTVDDSELKVSKLVRNLSDGTGWLDYVEADPDELVSFSIETTNTGIKAANDVIVRDVLPNGIIYQGNMKIDGVTETGDIISGINIGNLSVNQVKTIIFDAKVASGNQFSYGVNDLINTVTVHNTENADTDTAKVVVSGGTAVTTVQTGLTDNKILDYFLLPFAMSFILLFLFRDHIVSLNEFLEKKKVETVRYRSKRILTREVSRIREKEDR